MAKPSAWGSQQPQPLLVVLRRGFYPIPRPFPSPGEGMQPLASARSVTKVSATHQRVAGRFPTQQSCDCLCSLRSPQYEKPFYFGSLLRLFVFAPLTSMQKTIQFWFLLGLFCGLRPSHSNFVSNELSNTQNETRNNDINTEAQRYRVFIFLCVSVPLCCIYI